MSVKRHAAFVACASVALMTAATPANAGTGCNGVVNPLVWGCAPWDNNNGPNFPYYKKKELRIPQAKAQVFNQNGVQLVKDLRTGQVHPVIANDGASVIATGGLN